MRFWHSFILIASLAFAPAVPAAIGESAASFSIEVQGQDGDFITGDRSYKFDEQSGTLTVRYYVTRLEFFYESYDRSDWWYFLFSAADGLPLTKNNYTFARRYPFNKDGEHGLSVTSTGRGCDLLAGSFELKGLRIDREGRLQHIDMSFVQRCGMSRSQAKGRIAVRMRPEPKSENLTPPETSLLSSESSLTPPWVQQVQEQPTEEIPPPEIMPEIESAATAPAAEPTAPPEPATKPPDDSIPPPEIMPEAGDPIPPDMAEKPRRPQPPTAPSAPQSESTDQDETSTELSS